MLKRQTNESLASPLDALSMTDLLPVMAVVFIGFLIIGIALPVLPLHVHHDLGLSTFVVGLVTGSQFAASLISRIWAGNFADTKGSKQAVILGLLTAIASGALYLLSLQFAGSPEASAIVLLTGRAVLGAAESLIITGAISWGLTLVGQANAGRVIAWMGMAMFTAFAVGAPLGTSLYSMGGFSAVALATIFVSFVTLLLVAPLSAVAPARTTTRPALMRVAHAVWMPGIGSGLSSLGFGAVVAFSALISVEREWQPVWLPFTAFAMALVAARAFLGHIPDGFGGARERWKNEGPICCRQCFRASAVRLAGSGARTTRPKNATANGNSRPSTPTRPSTATKASTDALPATRARLRRTSCSRSIA